MAHKRALVSALTRALAERLTLFDEEYGRKGFLAYVKSLAGSVVKVVPAGDNGSASESQASKTRAMRVICGNHTAVIASGAWTSQKTPLSFCELRVNPHSVVVPNIGTTELAEALSRVLPFTAIERDRPALQCVLFRAKDGKLTMTSTDAHRLAEVKIDLDGVEGEALIHRNGLKGLPSALKLARRARIGFEKTGESLDGMRMVIATELITYKLNGREWTFPDYEKLIPTEFKAVASLDSIGTAKAIASIKALATADNPKADYHINIVIGNGKVVMTAEDTEAEIPAETEGESHISLHGTYFADALRACGTLADFKVINAVSPAVFATNGCRIVTIPMSGKWYAGDKRAEEARQEAEKAKAEAEASKPAVPVETVTNNEAEKAQAVAEAEAITQAEPTETVQPEASEPTEPESKKRKRELAGVA